MGGEKPDEFDELDKKSIIELENCLKHLGFIGSVQATKEHYSHQELLDGLTRLRACYTGDKNPVTKIDSEILALTRKKRCGMQLRIVDQFKIDEFEVLKFSSTAHQADEVGWESRTITYSIDDISLLTGINLSSTEAKTGIRRAADEWNLTCGLNLTESNQDPQIVISAVLNDPHEIEDAIAHGDYPVPNNLFGSPLKIHFNARESWTIGSLPGHYDLVRVTMHELGHCLGLFHYPGTLMNEVIVPADNVNEIENSIQDRIFDLYGP